MAEYVFLCQNPNAQPQPLPEAKHTENLRARGVDVICKANCSLGGAHIGAAGADLTL